MFPQIPTGRLVADQDDLRTLGAGIPSPEKCRNKVHNVTEHGTVLTLFCQVFGVRYKQLVTFIANIRK